MRNGTKTHLIGAKHPNGAVTTLCSRYITDPAASPDGLHFRATANPSLVRCLRCKVRMERRERMIRLSSANADFKARSAARKAEAEERLRLTVTARSAEAERLFRLAVQWIADNDEPTLATVQGISEQIAVVLTADVFNVSPVKVAQLVLRARAGGA